MFMNETATQNIWQHHFLEPCVERRGKGALWDKLAHRGSGNNAHEFDENIDSSLPPVTHIWVTLSDLFTHFTIKRTQM
jgi:hypothetical protein